MYEPGSCYDLAHVSIVQKDPLLCQYCQKLNDVCNKYTGAYNQL